MVVVLPIYKPRLFVSAYTHTLIPLQYIIAFCLFRVLLLISSGFLPTREVTSHEPDSRFCARVVMCVCVKGKGAHQAAAKYELRKRAPMRSGDWTTQWPWLSSY